MNPELVENERGRGYIGQTRFIYYFRNEAEERYARLLAAHSPFSRRPPFMGPVIEDGKLYIESSGRRAEVTPEDWEGLKDAIIRVTFAFAPKRTRPSPNGG